MTTFLEHAAAELQSIREQGLFKAERTIDSPQQTDIRLQDKREVLNLCANNYLGLANHPEIIRAAHEALDRWGYGMSSVRFICGTQTTHKTLEQKLRVSSGLTTRFFTDRVLMPTAGCLKLC